MRYPCQARGRTAPAPGEQPANRPAHERRYEHHDASGEQAIVQWQCIEPRKLLVASDRQIALEQVGCLALRISTKGDGFLIAHLAEDQRFQLDPAGWLRTLPGYHQVAVVRGAHRDW